jgi:hypothetical protein
MVSFVGGVHFFGVDATLTPLKSTTSSALPAQLARRARFTIEAQVQNGRTQNGYGTCARSWPLPRTSDPPKRRHPNPAKTKAVALLTATKQFGKLVSEHPGPRVVPHPATFKIDVACQAGGPVEAPASRFWATEPPHTGGVWGAGAPQGGGGNPP